MTKPLPTTPLRSPNIRPVSPEAVAVGLPVPPISRVKIMSALEWEEFVVEWADFLRAEYEKVERCGGAGDMGRDVVAIVKAADGAWDNYQCKHYATPLSPDDIWLEIGKAVYFTHVGQYTCPRRYFFVAPCGVGTKLSNLLRRPDELRAQLAGHWDGKCRDRITSTKQVPLTGALRSHHDRFDFSIFQSLPPLTLIDQHAQTRYYVARFGGALPARSPAALPPPEPAPREAVYVRCLLDAYSNHAGRSIPAPADVRESHLQEHFKDSRVEFYSAESLRSFSRDTLPPGEFEKLQDDVHSGIRDDIRTEHADGYARVLAATRTARSLQLAAHALNTRIGILDRGGICHQLANDGKVKWVS